jgi:bifunctional dethiobiotin synthetase / adenosylmethionine---8-amino-7-oxononanoate aminotransferase
MATLLRMHHLVSKPWWRQSCTQRSQTCSSVVGCLRRHASSARAAAANGHYVFNAALRDSDVLLQVYGANTDVGKTIVSAGLCKAALRSGTRTSYIKPVQTGSDSDADALATLCHGYRVGPTAGEAHAATAGAADFDACTLYWFSDPVSPHLAAAKDGRVVSDAELLQALVQQLHTAVTPAELSGSFTLVETAGGPLSPGPSGTLQADLYRPLRLPVLLVGDPRLGGISTTLSALESLRLRGYTVVGIAFVGASHTARAKFAAAAAADAYDHAYAHAADNAAAVAAEAQGVPVFALGAGLPPQPQPLDEWHSTAGADFDELLAALRLRRQASVADAATHKQRAFSTLWWPFTQHGALPAEGSSVTAVDSAYGDCFSALEHKLVNADSSSSSSGSSAVATAAAAVAAPQYTQAVQALHDAPASWWTQGVGHGNPVLALAAAAAAGRYGHVLFPGTTHAPALRLAEELVHNGPGRGWAARAFYTDDGSTAMEVAIKMALRAFAVQRWGSSSSSSSSGEVPAGVSLEVVAQAGCYHGDTLGTMHVAAPSVFNRGQHPWYTPRGLFLDPPALAWKNGRYTLQLPPAMACALQQSQRELRGTLDGGVHFADRAAAFDVQARAGASQLFAAYCAHAAAAMEAHEAASSSSDSSSVVLGALVLEPLLIGAGGMHLADPLWQKALVVAARARGLTVVYDEVFSGLWRLGYESCREVLREDPDIAAYAKLLTGGLVPLAATLAAERVFAAFSSSSSTAQALLHGHSYTAHPVGCAAALHALSAYKASPLHPGRPAEPLQEQWNDAGTVRELSLLPGIARAVSLGGVLAVELEVAQGGYSSAAGSAAIAALRQEGVLARALGNVLYCMVTPLTEPAECDRLLAVFSKVLKQLAADKSSGSYSSGSSDSSSAETIV